MCTAGAAAVGTIEQDEDEPYERPNVTTTRPLDGDANMYMPSQPNAIARSGGVPAPSIEPVRWSGPNLGAHQRDRQHSAVAGGRGGWFSQVR